MPSGNRRPAPSRAAGSRSRSDGHAIAEAGAGDRTAYAIGAARAIAVARAGRECGRTKVPDIGALVRIAVSGQALGIAEAAGLNLLDGFIDRRRRGAAGREIASLHRFARASRLRGCFEFRFRQSLVDPALPGA